MSIRVDLGSVIGPKEQPERLDQEEPRELLVPRERKEPQVRMVPKAQLVLLEHAAAAGTKELQSPVHLRQQPFLQEAGLQTRW